MSDFDIVDEDVPPFTRRVGDNVLQGSNNVIVILGTDRARLGPATISDGLGTVESVDDGTGSGTYHVIAGRTDEDGNPDLDKDLSYIYLSMKSDVDDNLGTSMEKSDNKIPCAIVKSDALRFVARKSIKIVIDDSKYMFFDGETCVIKLGSSFMRMSDDKIILDSGNIELGEGAAEKVILGSTFMELFNQHVHPTGTGPSLPPTIPMTDAQHLSQRVVKVK